MHGGGGREGGGGARVRCTVLREPYQYLTAYRGQEEPQAIHVRMLCASASLDGIRNCSGTSFFCLAQLVRLFPVKLERGREEVVLKRSKSIFKTKLAKNVATSLQERFFWGRFLCQGIRFKKAAYANTQPACTVTNLLLPREI